MGRFHDGVSSTRTPTHAHALVVSPVCALFARDLAGCGAANNPVPTRPPFTKTGAAWCGAAWCGYGVGVGVCVGCAGTTTTPTSRSSSTWRGAPNITGYANGGRVGFVGSLESLHRTHRGHTRGCIVRVVNPTKASLSPPTHRGVECVHVTGDCKVRPGVDGRDGLQGPRRHGIRYNIRARRRHLQPRAQLHP